MPSWQAIALNKLFKITVKPLLKWYVRHYVQTKNIKIIHRLRQLIAKWPVFLPPQAHVQSLILNGVSVTEVHDTTNCSSRILIYLHGGAYIMGTPHMYTELAYRLASACKMKVLLVDYHLAPEYPFPHALDDVMKVCAWFYEHEINLAQVVIGGDSAGGGLALAALIALRDQHFYLPAAAVLLSPWTDLALTGASLDTNKNKDPLLVLPPYQLYVSAGETRHPLASPLYADLHSLPPLLIQVSNTEILLDDSRRIAANVQEHGGHVKLEIWDNLPHIWPLFARFLPEGRAAIANIAKFINNISALG